MQDDLAKGRMASRLLPGVGGGDRVRVRAPARIHIAPDANASPDGQNVAIEQVDFSYVDGQLALAGVTWAFAYSGVAGAIVLVTADIAARLVLWPSEAPAGLITAIIGAPILAALARGTMR